MEEQILFRVPPEIAARLHRLIEEGKSSSTSSSSSSSSLSSSSTSSVSLTLHPTRRGVLHLDKSSYEGTLVDLPCVIETHKTFDNLSYYKSADIAQMLILHPLPTPTPPTTTPGTAVAGVGGGGGAEKAKEAVGPPPSPLPLGAAAAHEGHSTEEI